MSLCSICSAPQFETPQGIDCENGHVNAPAQSRVVLEPGKEIIPVEKLVKIYIRIRDAKAEKKRAYEAEATVLDTQMDMITTELKSRAISQGVDGFKTAAGTVYMSESMKASCADWGAFGEFLKTHDPLQYLEKRVSVTAIKEFMEETEGQLPPGISIFKESEARIRRAGEK